MTDLDLANKRVIVREDLNVPLENGVISNDARIRRAVPTLKRAIQDRARILVLSHLDRPKEGTYDERFSLAPVADALSRALGQKVNLVKNWLDGFEVSPGEIVLAENVRFLRGENDNDPQLAKRMASSCDIFVMDAFATAHRAQASTVGIAEYAPLACAGPLLDEELEVLSKVLEHPKRPLVAIVGGAKVSTKIHVLYSLLQKVNRLILGGGIANTFLKASGHAIGKSLYEEEWIGEAKKVLSAAKEQAVDIPLPVDVRVATAFSADAQAQVKSIDAVGDEELILDVGPKTSSHYRELLAQAQTIVWNGPVGVFEFPQFSEGTKSLAKAVADSSAFSIVGGGDTLAAIEKFGVEKQISYVSTAGGAFLEFLEGRKLPGIEALERFVPGEREPF